MATITTAVYLDDAARTAGEAMTINGGSLTVRTDTRWHANSPASMTGSLGSVTISATLGGSYVLDGRDVRWLAYDSGSGNVPAVGTVVVQGGAGGPTGTLLGVWASLTSAPTAVGAAMPATGFMKFREVVNGPFSAGAVVGIGASATGADVVGWIEVVHDQATAITVPRLGNFTVRGDWFELGTTSGSANQLLQVPTNGSATNSVPGVWIETATADVYEFVPAIWNTWLSTTDFGTDERSKFVNTISSGEIRIGHNGTTTVGYVWPAGRKVRIPNVLGRQCATGSRATNAYAHATLGTRPDFATTGAGQIDIENFATDWYCLFAQPYSVKLNHFATFDTVNISECATALDLLDGGAGVSQSSLDINALALTSNFAGGTVTDWSAHRFTTGSNDHAVSASYCYNQTFDNVRAGIITFARTTSGVAFYLNGCSGVTLNNLKQFNGQTTINASTDITVNDLDHCDRYVGATNATSGIYAVSVTGMSQRVKVDGVTFGLNAAVADCHPYLGVFYSAASADVKFRNLGTRAAFVSGGSASNPAYIFVSGGNNRNVKVQRAYMTPTRTGAVSTLNSDTGNVYEHVYGDFADGVALAGLREVAKNCGGTSTTTGQTSVYGTHFWDVFTSDTAGRVVCAFNEATAETADYVTVIAGTPKFSSAGYVLLQTSGDEIEIEQHYFSKGCTALPANNATVSSGAGVTHTHSSGGVYGTYLVITYQIDTGSGWNGTWKQLTGTNLSGEAVDPADGFKLKYRIAANANNSIYVGYIRIDTTSTLTAQTDNLYPLDTAPVTVTVKDANTGDPVENARVRVTADVGGTLVLEGVTNASGVLTGETDVVGVAVTGKVRRATAAHGTLYRPGSFSDSVDETDGLAVTVLLIPDE